MSKTVRDDPQAALRDLIRDGRAVIVAGTGVSMAASSHPQASWTGLLEHGFEWLKEHRHIDEQDAEAQLRLLKKNPQTHRFISAAQDVMDGMGGSRSKHFKQWLEETVGSIKAKDRAVLDALNAIRQHGHLLATTNYDGLLLGEPPKLNAITWQEKDELIGAARDWNTDKIIFLHGYWRKPESVILDWTSYEQIARDTDYRDDFAAFWKTNTWVYVGCGVSGLSDPDFGLLLERYGARARQAGHWDYCLVCGETQRHEFQAHFDTLKLNLLAVSYGESRSGLGGYLRSLLPPPDSTTNSPVTATPSFDPSSAALPIPRPPAFYAEPHYIGSHQFVGRDAELQALSDWANRSDPTNLLLFEAIGGNGKSMLTWEWTTKHATTVRTDWAGRFWYSFYERGAIMQDFCQRALTYITGQPPKEFEKRKTAELADELIAQLHARPWLLILDGLERVLVAYHRIDAAEVPDEEVDAPTDKILNRNPCNTIRDEDGDLIRALAACSPSKILISSRLTPRVLLNSAGQPVLGAKRITLPGLRPPDAETLLRQCGITGDSVAIQDYLRRNCDNHPLVIGIVAGLIASYLPNRGNFDAWSVDLSGGAALDLANLDLIQRRNHILHAAIADLSNASRQLLSTLALLSDEVDYETVAALNPHLPPEPAGVEKPEAPEKAFHWNGNDLVPWEHLSDEEKAEVLKEHNALLTGWLSVPEVKEWLESAAYREAPKRLNSTVADLEHRGLLRYDRRTRRYDLHPVVRGVVTGGMKAADKERYGQRVVDHYMSMTHSPYEQAKTMGDVETGLRIVRTLLKLGHHQQAANVYRGDLATALVANLEAYAETLSLLRLFFPTGWDAPPIGVTASDASSLAGMAAVAFDGCGELQQGLGASVVALRGYLEMERWCEGAIPALANISLNLSDQNFLAKAIRLKALVLDLASANEASDAIFKSRLNLFGDQSRLGQWQAADVTWQLLDPMGRVWGRNFYRQGDAEYYFARVHFWQGSLQEEHLTAAATLAGPDGNRAALRALHQLRGTWRLEQGEWALAAASFDTAVTMAREVRLVDAESETALALAKHHLGQLSCDAARSEAERLAGLRQPAHRYLAMLWLALGDRAQAKHHALAAYKWAWADGEPYVNRYELTQTTELLRQMNVPVPVLPPYDPAKDEPFPWEADVRAAIEKLKSENEAKKQQGKP